MPRTIVYASDIPPPPAPPPEELLQPKSAGTPRKKKPTVVEPTGPTLAADKYGDKFVKYIPAETIAFYAPLVAISELDLVGRAIICGLGLVVTIVYLVVRAKREKLKPPPAYYVLGALAFVAWAIGTSDLLTAATGLEDLWAKVIFGAAVFLIPGIDEAFVT